MKLRLVNPKLSIGITLGIALNAGCGITPTTSDNPDAAGSIQNQATATKWAKTTLSPATSSLFSSVTVDSSGNVYAAGQLSGPGTLNFGNNVTVTAASNGNNALLLKCSSSGAAQWAQTQAGDGGSYGAQFSSVAVDATGNVYTAGYISGASGTVDFGNGVTVAKSDSFGNAVLVKYNSSGAAQWAQALAEDSSDSHFNSVAVDASGYVYVAGEILGTGTYNFGNNVTAAGTAVVGGLLNTGGNAVLAKYDTSGVAQWAQSVSTGSLGSSFSSVAADATGNVYAAGSIGGTDTYGFGNSVTATGSASLDPIADEVDPNVVLVKYNSSGVAQWAQTDTADNASRFRSVALDSVGNVYAAGSIGENTVDFGHGITAMGIATHDQVFGFGKPGYVVLVKYDSLGIAQWARTVTNAGPDSGFDSVAVDCRVGPGRVEL